MTRTRHKAFSLVELSIVLVILGLLVGGILAGKSLIRASELRSVTTDFTRYQTSAMAFRDKYFYLPGDLPNATQIWGPLDSGNGIGSDCGFAESIGIPTCNGNGDGVVNDNTPTAGTYETYLFWKHLSNAGLIEGNYTGTFAQTTNSVCISASALVPGCNAPTSKFATSSMFVIMNVGSITGNSYLFDGDYGQSMILMKGPQFAGATSPIMIPEELWNIDTKLDDGMPATGKIVASRWNYCAVGASSVSDLPNARYKLTDTTPVCTAYFRKLF